MPKYLKKETIRISRQSLLQPIVKQKFLEEIEVTQEDFNKARQRQPGE